MDQIDKLKSIAKENSIISNQEKDLGKKLKTTVKNELKKIKIITKH